jgi:membrane-associated phospholipid phosphatase
MGIIGTSSTYFVDRYRPYVYTNETPMDRRTSKVARNSFFSGHVEMVAAPLFLIAKVYSDYYPESNVKWVFYGFAASVTTFTSYIRLKGGDHFPSDILLGALIGTLSGILVPEFHKNKNSDLSILPYGNEMAKGLSLTYQF